MVCRSDALRVGLLGRFEERDVGPLLAAYALWRSPQIDDALSVLSDASQLEGIDAAAYKLFAAFIERNLPDFASRTVRHALVRPVGIEGAIIAGFYEVLGQPSYPVRVFTSAVEALKWLGRTDTRALADHISSLVAAASAVPETVQRLRALLATNLDLRLATAARAIGVSERSLQRQLQRARTSLRSEVDAARIRAAQTLLADTDAKITAIALEIGCATPQHFSALFRKTTGETPSAWRARRRSVAST